MTKKRFVWEKDTEGHYGDFLLAWITSATICPDLPRATVIIGVFDFTDVDDDYWLHSFLSPQSDDYDETYLDGVIETEAALQYGDDPDDLAREAREIMTHWLRTLPEWFTNWYRESLEMQLEEARP